MLAELRELDCTRDPLIREDFGRAEGIATRLLESEELDDRLRAEVYWRRGFVRMELQDRAAARADAEAALRLAPDCAPAHVVRAHSRPEDEEPDSGARVMANLDDALRHDPNLAHAYVLRSSVYLQRGEFNKAVQAADRAFAIDSDGIWTRQMLAVLALEHAKADANATPSQTLKWIDHCRQRFPDIDPDGNLRGASALCLAMTGEMDRARRHALFALQFDKTDALAWRALYLVATKRGELFDVLLTADELLRADLGSHDLHHIRGGCLQHFGRFDEALAAFDQAHATATTDAERLAVAESRSGTLLRAERWTDALSSCEAALALDPENSECLASKALILASCPDAKLRDGKLALELAEKACSLSQPANFDALHALVAALVANGRQKEAREHLTRLQAARTGSIDDEALTAIVAAVEAGEMVPIESRPTVTDALRWKNEVHHASLVQHSLDSVHEQVIERCDWLLADGSMDEEERLATLLNRSEHHRASRRLDDADRDLDTVARSGGQNAISREVAAFQRAVVCLDRLSLDRNLDQDDRRRLFDAMANSLEVAAVNLEVRQGCRFLAGWLAAERNLDDRDALQRAYREIDAALPATSEFADGFYFRALLGARLGDHQGALRDIERCLSLDPAPRLIHLHAEDAYFLHADLLIRTGDPRRAIVQTLVAQAFARDDPRIVPTLARAHFAAGRPWTAIDCCRRWIARDADALAPRLLAARALLEVGRHEMALAHLETTLARCDEATLSPDDCRNVADIFVVAGRHADAIRRLDALLAAHPQDYEAWILKSRLHAGSGDERVRDAAAALSAVERAAEIHRRDHRTFAARACAQAAAGEFDKAVETLDAILGLLGNDSPTAIEYRELRDGFANREPLRLAANRDE